MKRTRKWTYVEQEAVRLSDLGLRPSQIAKELGVNESTVRRWRQAGKLGVRRPKVVSAPLVAGESPEAEPRALQTPAEWAAEVRRSYQLDATDDQLVTLAERALMDAQIEPSASVRMSAAKTFQSIAKQLALVARTAPKVEEPQAPKVREPLRVVSRRDPRRLLVVNE